MIRETFREGVVAERGGRFWSRTESDGNARRPVGDDDGFGPIECAHISDPRCCHKPTDMTWDPERAGGANPDLDILKGCRLLPVSVRTIYVVDFPEVTP